VLAFPATNVTGPSAAGAGEAADRDPFKEKDMIDALFYAALAALGLGAAVTALVFWDDIRDRLAGWLRQKGLHKSALMDALVRLDDIAGRVRCRLFATARRTGTVRIDETVYDVNQIDDPEVLAELRKRGHAQRSVLHLID